MWTSNEINRLKSQHNHGWTVSDSAEILERSELDVRNKLISIGLKPIEESAKIPATISTKESTNAPAKSVRKRVHRITEEMKNKVIDLRDSEYKLADISANTGLSLTSVKRILKDSGRTNPHKIQTKKPTDTKPADNWLIGQLDGISNLMKNVKDVKEIGYALGRLDMLITVLKEDERRNNAR